MNQPCVNTSTEIPVQQKPQGGRSGKMPSGSCLQDEFDGNEFCGAKLFM